MFDQSDLVFAAVGAAAVARELVRLASDLIALRRFQARREEFRLLARAATPGSRYIDREGDGSWLEFAVGTRDHGLEVHADRTAS